LAAALLVSACSGGDTVEDVQPLPEQTAETANALMTDADRAADAASKRAATSTGAARSRTITDNEVTP
jgi:PBP1b-binding outer membrane lipoprotein LpoB